jgi:hypothetical protein
MEVFIVKNLDEFKEIIIDIKYFNHCWNSAACI